MTQLDYKKPSTPMTPQMRQAIGIGGLVLCLLLGGGIIWWFLWGSAPSRREVDVDTSQRSTLRGRQMPPARVSRNGANDWLVRGDAGFVRVTKSGGDYKLAFSYQSGLLGLSQEQINLLSGRFRIIQDEAMAKAWGVTPEQVEKLKKLDLGGGGALKPSDAERTEVRQLWDQYLAAPDKDKSAPQKKLVDKLDQIAANLEPSKKALVDRVNQIREILSAEQVQKISK